MVCCFLFFGLEICIFVKKKGMYLPNFTSAIIDIEKLTEYCLNEFHPKGKHKARLFKSVLNISIENADYLKDLIIKGICEYPAIEQETDEFGKRFTVDISIRKNTEIIILRTNWIIKINEQIPRLTSCFIKL